MAEKPLGLSGGGYPRRKETQLGKEHNVVPAPGQPGTLSNNIQALETVWVPKYAREISDAPSATNYKFIQQEEGRAKSLLGPNGRGIRDLPASPRPFRYAWPPYLWKQDLVPFQCETLGRS